MPVYEERPLFYPYYGFSSLVKSAALPLGLPPEDEEVYNCTYTDGADGLQLATNGDILVGRADHGTTPSRPSSSPCCSQLAINGHASMSHANRV